MTTYYHGGPSGLRTRLLPPSKTRARCSADYVGDGACSRLRVYVTTSFEAAQMFASGHPSGAVYEVEPEGAIEQDPDCDTQGLSFECETARIIRVYRQDAKTMRKIRNAIVGTP